MIVINFSVQILFDRFLIKMVTTLFSNEMLLIGSSFQTLSYSWNEGETWLTYEFLNTSRMFVYGLLTERGEQSAEFLIFGSHPGRHKWTIVQINLRNVLGRLSILVFRLIFNKWIVLYVLFF